MADLSGSAWGRITRAGLGLVLVAALAVGAFSASPAEAHESFGCPPGYTAYQVTFESGGTTHRSKSCRVNAPAPAEGVSAYEIPQAPKVPPRTDRVGPTDWCSILDVLDGEPARNVRSQSVFHAWRSGTNAVDPLDAHVTVDHNDWYGLRVDVVLGRVDRDRATVERLMRRTITSGTVPTCG